VGIDLAWGERNKTGLAALHADGRLLGLADAWTDDDIASWLAPYVAGPSLVAIDAPLIVTNATGRRPCEGDLNAVFARYDAGAHPSNTGKPEFAHGTRGARLADRLGLDMDPASRESHRAIEVYPHPATVALFGLDRTIKYKHKPGRDLEFLRAESMRLANHLEALATAEPPLLLEDNPAWTDLRAHLGAAQRKFQIRGVEDRIDAVLCAYVALYADRRPGDVTVFGDVETGYIVTPSLPADATAPASRAATSSSRADTGLTDDEVLERFSALRQHQQDGHRSPHKPLLVLTALGRLLATGRSSTPFTDVEGQLAGLIAAFGPPSRTAPATAAAYPFTRLRSDNVWQLDADVAMDLVTPLREHSVAGSFTPEIEQALQGSDRLVHRLAKMLVRSQFPDSLAGEVLVHAGLDPDLVLAESNGGGAGELRRRSVAWVREVITAWDQQCAFCGYDGQLAAYPVGVEAAHVRWFNLGGPDELDNGLALCALHHRLFDRGVLTVDLDHRVSVSGHFTGRTPAARAVYELHGTPLQPRRGTLLPAEEHLAWHHREVFKGAALSA